MFHFLFPCLQKDKCVTFKFLPMTQLTNCPSIHSLIPHAAYLNPPCTFDLIRSTTPVAAVSKTGYVAPLLTLSLAISLTMLNCTAYYHATLTISAVYLYCVQYNNFPYLWNTQTHCIKISTLGRIQYPTIQCTQYGLSFPHDKGTEVTSAAKLMYFFTRYLIRPPGVTRSYHFVIDLNL